MKFEAIHHSAAKRSAALPATGMLSTMSAILAVAAIAVAIQALWLPVDADVSWLITVSERVLAGDRLYVDILEVNPPASVWLYVPLVWIANIVGARPEAVVVAAFVAGAIASILATLRLASRLRDAPPPLLLAAVVAFVVLVLPMALFAQREHAALLLAIPALAALAVIADARKVGRTALYASGFAAGLVIVIKPHFLLAIVVPAAWAAWKRRSLSPLLPGIIAAVAAVALYALAVLLFAREYLDWLPVIAETYGPMREAWWKVMVGPTLYPAICLGLAILLRAPRVPSLTAVWALGAVGFAIAAFAQGKNYPNHWLPQAGLALIATFALLSLAGVAPLRRAAVVAGLAVVAACEMYYWTIIPDPAVALEIRRLAPPAPKVIGLSPQLTTGHPVTRNVGGKWVGSRAGLFTASGARVAGLNDDGAARAYRQDIQSFAADVRNNEPDVILVHDKSKAWLMREPVIAGAMAGYEFGAAAGDTEVWLRQGNRR